MGVGGGRAARNPPVGAGARGRHRVRAGGTTGGYVGRGPLLLGNNWTAQQ